ncbi:4-hydroxy-tetrahydrodipicolinate synthase, partial [Candidatus Xenohaliotis californiensis]|uniref:4-hydroxy-tetrahydrodipicolinate synthase n=1 Tax=Candidatus Xenohaliotis californiensis TaxID=84677 RepID=UPI0030C7C7C6
MLERTLWTACITPFNNNLGIDYESLSYCLKLQANAKNGLVLLGSTGEALSLARHECESILKHACSLNLSTEIVVGVPSYNMSIATEWIKFCEDLPIQGYLIATPMYTKPGLLGQTAWFEKLLNTITRPAILYNIPGRTGVQLIPEVVGNLCNHKNFVAIKDSGGCVKNFMEYKTIAKNIAIYCGDDHMMPAMSAMGASGLISVASNALPMVVQKNTQNCINGNKININTWWSICNALSTARNPIPIKLLMKKIGIIKNRNVRPPLN